MADLQHDYGDWAARKAGKSGKPGQGAQPQGEQQPGENDTGENQVEGEEEPISGHATNNSPRRPPHSFQPLAMLVGRLVGSLVERVNRPLVAHHNPRDALHFLDVQVRHDSVDAHPLKVAELSVALADDVLEQHLGVARLVLHRESGSSTALLVQRNLVVALDYFRH